MYRSIRERLAGADANLPGRLGLSQSPMDLEFAELSDLGRVREQNEDCFGHAAPATPEEALTRGWLFALADGVGGQDKGEVASRIAIDTLVQGFREGPAAESHASLLQRLVQTANNRILDAGHAGGSSGMATTIVACALRYDRLAVAHAGDSRCYLVRNGNATILTRDHTIANEHVRLGLISTEEAAQSPNRHMLCRSLGSELFVAVEVGQHQVQVGDVLLLCSDGLHGSVRPGDIGNALNPAANLSSAAQRLVALAKERDGSDNISLQLVRIRTVERVGMYRGRPYRLP